jgi:hypothetical protein
LGLERLLHTRKRRVYALAKNYQCYGEGTYGREDLSAPSDYGGGKLAAYQTRFFSAPNKELLEAAQRQNWD